MMWIRKPEEPILRAKILKKHKKFVLFFLGCFVVLILREKTGFESNSPYPGFSFSPIAWKEVVNELPILLFFSVAFGLVMASFQKKNTVVCPQCDILKQQDSVTICNCGEKFENADKFEWVENASKTDS